MSNLSIENVINVSVSEAQAGLGEYNTSNLAIFTEEPANPSFGSDGYKIYLDAGSVGEDFGTSSATYLKALSVFSQQPNILANNGYLVVILMGVESQTISFDAVPDAGAFTLDYGAEESASIAFDDTAADVQAALRTIEGLELVTVSGNFTDGFVVSFNGVYGDISLLTENANTLVDGATPVVITVTEDDAGETLEEAIERSSSLIEYFGLMATEQIEQADLLTIGALLETKRKIGFFGSNNSSDIAGKFTAVKDAGLDKVRCLYYGRGTENDMFRMVASYAGRALSTNFSGSNTTSTMHLKDLTGILPDNTMTQTLLNGAQTAGVDAYVSIQGVPKVFTSGANTFFDDVYNLLWFVGSLQIAGFNVLAQTSTKIPQTENGVDSLKSAYRRVCVQAGTNQFIAPGRWTSPDTFGNQLDFYENIEQRGYYIYSLPIGQQLPADREARKSPLIQIAIKYAGAIHSSNVIVNINR